MAPYLYKSIADNFPFILSKKLKRIKCQDHHKVYGVYLIDGVFDSFPIPINRDPKKKPYHPPKYITLEGFPVNVGSTRMRLFLRDHKNLACVSCGLMPTHWVLERLQRDVNLKIIPPPHLNLYSLVEDENNIKEILFTQDHIIPRGLGGSSSLKNLQVMCCICNNTKGNALDPTITPISGQHTHRLIPEQKEYPEINTNE